MPNTISRFKESKLSRQGNGGKSTVSAFLMRHTDSTLVQLLRYTFVGAIAFIADLSLLFIFTEYLRVYYLVSAAAAFLLGMAVNYTLSIFWVFNKRIFSSRHFEFAIFALIGIVGLSLNEIIIWFFTEHIHFYYLFSKIISAVFVYLWNFFARKFMLFR